jgi:DNA helicase-2/ATP-dependent DNA helicase PcrA
MDQWASIRQKAAQTLDDYRQRSGREPFGDRAGSYAVLEDLAECCLSLTVIDDPTLPFDVLGCLNLEEGSITYQSRLPKSRAAFVIAHEIGHFVLRHPPRDILPDGESHINEQPDAGELQESDQLRRVYHERDRRELEANVFAAELLAPLCCVRDRIRDNPQWTVEELAKYFGLSILATTNQVAAALFQAPAVQLRIEDTPRTLPPLDERQQQAVEAVAPALVIAGPGAGKTRVLVERFVHLVQNGVEPRRILALTFSNKAAGEMRERLTELLPEQAHEIEVTTFHALGLQLLLGYGTSIGLSPDLQLLTPTEIYVWLRNRISELPLGFYENLNRPTQHLQTLLNAFSRAKDELVDPAELKYLVNNWHQQIDINNDEEQAVAARCADVAAVYEVYQRWLREAGFVDYGDLINEAVRLFEIPTVGEAIQSTFDHILVDEFQDINYASGRLVRALDGGRGIVWAVGDPRQSIYGFRGASRANLSQFTSDYPSAHVLALDINYRSVEPIVQAGSAISFPESDEIPLPVLHSQRGQLESPPAITIGIAPTKAAEVVGIVEQVASLLQTTPPEQIAILCRRRDKAHQIAQALEKCGIATTWQGQAVEGSLFKDLLGLLLLLNDEPMGLLRLSRLAEHHFAETDLRVLLDVAHEAENSLRAALEQAPTLATLSEDGRARAQQLLNLITALESEPTPWHMLTSYLFSYARWPREMWLKDTFAEQRELGAAGQLLGLARDWSQRNTPLQPRSSARETLSGFIDFIRTSLEAGELPCPSPPPTRNAVHVLTMHGSKGLEWPIVILPDCVENVRRRDELPLPPGLIRDGSEPDDDHERAALFYVAATRARDRLILTHAEKQGRQNCKPLPFLDDVRRAAEALQSLEEKYFDAVALTQEPQEPPTAWRYEGPISYRALVEYEECGQRFKYCYGYRLSQSQQSYRGFHRRLYATLNWIARQAAEGTLPDQNSATKYFENSRDAGQNSIHPFEPLYERHAQRIIASFLQRVRPHDRISFRQTMKVPLPGHSLHLMLDEIEEGSPRILRRHHFGRPAAHHRDEHLLALLQDEKELSVRLHYPLHNHEEEVQRTDKVIQNRQRKMEELWQGIENGDFQPNPDAHRCATCPFNLICPA